MYDYASLKRQTGQDVAVEPSDNLLVNDRALNQLVDGYRHLTVSGRGIVGQTVKTTAVPGRRGVWVDDVSDDERELVVKYRLTADSSSQLRDRFAQLNKVLRTVAPSGFLELSFKDEPNFIYYGYFSGADEVEETSLTVVSKFTLLVPDGYKKKRSQTSTGAITLTDALEVLPERLTVTPTATVNQLQIVNGDKVLSFRGAYAPGQNLVITWGADEVTITYGGRSILSELERFSPLELFTLKNGDRVTARNARVVEVVWRDERL